MSVAAGQLLAYLKIGVLDFGILAAVWAIVTFFETTGRRLHGGGDERAPTDRGYAKGH